MNKKFNVVMLDVSGSIYSETLPYLDHIPSLVKYFRNVEQTVGSEDYNFLLLPSCTGYILGSIHVCLPWQQLGDVIASFKKSLSNNLNVGAGSDFTKTLKNLIAMANIEEMEISRVLYITDGYDHFGSKEYYRDEYKYNPELKIELLLTESGKNNLGQIKDYDTFLIENILTEIQVKREKEILEHSLLVSPNTCSCVYKV